MVRYFICDKAPIFLAKGCPSPYFIVRALLRASHASLLSQKFHAEAGAALERGIVISLSERQAMVASTSCLPQEEAIELLKLTSTREAVCAGALLRGALRGLMRTIFEREENQPTSRL